MSGMDKMWYWLVYLACQHFGRKPKRTKTHRQYAKTHQIRFDDKSKVYRPHKEPTPKRKERLDRLMDRQQTKLDKSERRLVIKAFGPDPTKWPETGHGYPPIIIRF